jgi:hypothetical protein
MDVLRPECDQLIDIKYALRRASGFTLKDVKPHQDLQQHRYNVLLHYAQLNIDAIIAEQYHSQLFELMSPNAAVRLTRPDGNLKLQSKVLLDISGSPQTLYLGQELSVSCGNG